jgi:predicted AlkP superfamily phosphohydrolase/phosphomutase
MFEGDERAVYPADILPAARDAFAASAGASQWDEFYARAARDVNAERPVRLEAVRYQGLDTAGHQYLLYAQPRGFGDVSSEERQQYGAVLDRAYASIDSEIGAALERQAPGDLLLVVSGFGMQAVSPIKHLAARVLRDPDVSGTHENAPDGFMLAYGTPVAAGRKQRGSIVDVTPTILYFLGVPIGRDMDGYARADLFTPAVTAERPITFIPSHGR